MRNAAIAAVMLAMFVCSAPPVGADQSADSEKLVKSFIDSWTTKPIDEIVGHLDENVTFINIPEPKPIKGRADAKAFLEPFFRKDPLIVPFTFTTKIDHIVANDGTVMLDRVDTFVIAGKTWSVPVATLFEVKNGKITVWKDYFDQAQFQAPATLIETLVKKK